METPVRLSQDSLFGFLSSTRLPVVSSAAAVVRWTSIVFAIAGAVFAGGCILAFDDPWWSRHLPLSGAFPSLVSAPIFALAWWQWNRERKQRSAFWMFVALFAWAVLVSWPRGVFSPSWFLVPFFSLLATIGLGVIPGLGLTLGAVITMLALGTRTTGLPTPDLPNLWLHVTSLCALTLASALAGAITNRLVSVTLAVAESQRKKSYQKSRALRYREKLLRHAQRVETVGDVAGMVCHQLRNAHQVMIGHVAMAELADDEERKRRLGLIDEALQGTQPLLDQLMRMAHPDEGATALCDLTSLLRQFLDQAGMLLPSHIELSSALPGDAAFAMLNPVGLNHALWNLVVNARQAVTASGSIELRLLAGEDLVSIEVADDGPGIPEAARARIFDPYFTTKPPGKGTGLGLTAVRRFVHASNGTIAVECGEGGGTTFRLSFPRTGSKPEGVEARSPARSSSQAS